MTDSGATYTPDPTDCPEQRHAYRLFHTKTGLVPRPVWSRELCVEARAQWLADPSGLTDDHISAFATQDPTWAMKAYDARVAARTPPPPPPAATKTTTELDPRRVVTVGFLQKVLIGDNEMIIENVAELIKAALTPVLERIAALESRPLLKWAGIHVEGQEYAEAQLVTRSGSLWVSTSATKSTPGTPDSDWRLIVKKGQTQ